MDLYIERHDGSAATCEDFLIAMSDANGKDLSQFARWYSTKGTPMVKYDGKYDVEASTYYLTLTQESTSADPLHIPVAVGLLDKKSGDEVVATQILELKNTTQTFEFRGLINGDVLPSMLRGFSAPVKLVGSSEDEVKDWAFLAAHDTDGFNRWDSGQKLYGKAIFQTLRGEDCSKTMDCIYDAFKRYLAIDTNDLSIQAFSLKLPSESTLSEEMTTIDPIGLHKARGDVKKSIARRFYSQIRAKYDELSTATEGKESSIDAESIGQRRLRNELLDYLCAVNETPYEREAASQLAFDQFNSSYGMTNKYAALSCLVSMDGEEKVIERRESAIKQFYQDAEGDDLIKNKWFTVQAGADLPDTVDRVKALAKHPDFTLSNPNRFRSLVATFSANAPHFHSVDGEGYKFLGDLVNQVDKLNPQTSSRYGKPLIQWKRYNEEQGALMKAELQKLADMKPISNDLFEVICRGLKD
jgi:aminopeptidase N